MRGVNLWGWEKNVECLIRYTLKEKTKRPFKMVSRLPNKRKTRQKDKRTERQKDRKTKRQKDKKTERQKGLLRWFQDCGTS